MFDGGGLMGLCKIFLLVLLSFLFRILVLLVLGMWLGFMKRIERERERDGEEERKKVIEEEREKRINK